MRLPFDGHADAGLLEQTDAISVGHADVGASFLKVPDHSFADKLTCNHRIHTDA